MRIKYHVADYDINAIDKPFVQEFFAYLQGYRREGKIRCAVNGALKHITRFKRVMNLALQNEWINRNPVTLLHVKRTCRKRIPHRTGNQANRRTHPKTSFGDSP